MQIQGGPKKRLPKNDDVFYVHNFIVFSETKVESKDRHICRTSVEYYNSWSLLPLPLKNSLKRYLFKPGHISVILRKEAIISYQNRLVQAAQGLLVGLYVTKLTFPVYYNVKFLKFNI